MLSGKIEYGNGLLTLSLTWGLAPFLKRWLITASFLPITALCRAVKPSCFTKSTQALLSKYALKVESQHHKMIRLTLSMASISKSHSSSLSMKGICTDRARLWNGLHFICIEVSDFQNLKHSKVNTSKAFSMESFNKMQLYYLCNEDCWVTVAKIYMGLMM